MIDAKSLKMMYFYIASFEHEGRQVVMFAEKETPHDYVFYFCDNGKYVLASTKQQVQFANMFIPKNNKG